MTDSVGRAHPRGSLFLLLALAGVGSGCASVSPGARQGNAIPAWSAGPLASHDRATGGEDRARALGPFYESQASTNGLRFTGVRPFFSAVEDPAHDRGVREYLWPLATSRRHGDAQIWRWLIFFGADRESGNAKSRDRLWLFPFLFTGRGDDGRYFALFPLGGTIQNFLFREHIQFVLWPIYSHTHVHDLHSYHVLWPFINWTRGEDERGWRVFPFYGQYNNGGRTLKRFVLWPFWTSIKYGYPTEKGHAYVLFPIYGRVKTDRQEGWMVLPPFFKWSRSEKLTMANLPYPFFQYSKGEVDKLYIWPLWGRRTRGHVDKQIWLWPFIRQDRLRRAEGVTSSLRIFPVYYAETTRVTNSLAILPTTAVTNEGANVAAVGTMTNVVTGRHLRLWPLFSYQRVGDRSNFRTVELWPLRDKGPVERNLAPLWTLLSRRQVGEDREWEFMWGLWRKHTGADGSRYSGLFPLYARWGNPERETRGWSLLWGLVGREREALKTRTRLLYFIRIDSKPDAASESAASESSKSGELAP